MTQIVDPIDGTRSFITGHPLFGFFAQSFTAVEPSLRWCRSPDRERCFQPRQAGRVP